MTASQRDAWWMGQFKRLIATEEAGRSPLALENRWALLSYRTSKHSRWRLGFELPETINHLLDDADIRAKDVDYAQKQWAAAREWLHA